VNGVDYPHKDERASVSGQIVLADPLAPDVKMSNILVGLSAPDYMPPRFGRGFAGGRMFNPGGGGEDDTATLTNTVERVAARTGTNSGGGFRRFGSGYTPRLVDWQMDAKHYEFWVHADDEGRFTIPKVRSGTYTLHVIADGVLGEYALSNVVATAAQSVDLGKLAWQPVRYGHQLWEIGIPDRTAAEFFHGDNYWHWGLYQDYPKDFPNDVNFVINQSDYHKDWNYCQVPRSDGGGRGAGTTWSIHFDLPKTVHGKATLRLAFAATSARNIQVTVNDQPAGGTGPLQDTATIRRDGIRGYWYERAVAFDAALLKAGTNILKLTIPPGGTTSGVEYDYLRLELDESAAPPVGEQTKLSSGATYLSGN
jgi:rhamnogalacturonan endolyase